MPDNSLDSGFPSTQPALKRILVPVDGSPLAEQALPWALPLTQLTDAELHVALVHVPDAYADTAHWEDMGAEIKGRERRYLNELRDRLAARFAGAARFHHLEGLVPETLVEEVMERKIDLVVMNVHGWGYVTRSIVGSVSDYLLRHVHVPLLLTHAPPGAEPTCEPVTAPRRILICLDGSRLSETILPLAEQLARLWNSELRLLRVVPPLASLGEPRNDEQRAMRKHLVDKATDAANSYLRRIATEMASFRVATEVTHSSHVAAAILDAATAADCDLIAVATHGRTGLSRLVLGSVADKIVRGAHTPVLICRPNAT